MSLRVVCMIIVSAVLFAAGGTYADQTPHIGKVIKTMNAGNYTFMKLDEDGKEVWLASQPMKVSVGDRIEYIGGVPMKDFRSATLNRTFESILLITRIKNLNDVTAEEKQETESNDGDGDFLQKAKSVAEPGAGEIERAENGKTVGEIFSERVELKEKEVVLRAKVLKINEGILGKNWITLSDGTGTAPDNKIIATTSGMANLGDIVTVKGVVKNDVSIGSNYNYKVMIGNAELTQ